MTQTSDALRSLADRFWEGYLAAYPTWATVIGDRRFDDRLEDASHDAIAGRIRWLDGVADAGESLDPDSLTPIERVTRQMLVDEARGQADALRTGMHEWTVDPLGGPTVGLLDLPDYQVIRTPADGRALVARWRETGRYLDQVRAGLREAAADGRTAVITPVQRQFLDAYGQGHALYTARRFAEALTAFHRAAGFAPNDEMTQSLIEEASHLAENPPPPDWEPVLTLKTK